MTPTTTAPTAPHPFAPDTGGAPRNADYCRRACPVCNGELAPKKVEKLLRGGNHVAVLRVEAETCLHCGERLYDAATVRRFEDIRAKLERQELETFQPLGQSFQVA